MIEKDKYFRVGIYLRLSNEDKDKQNKSDLSESIKNQRNMLIQYINTQKNFILIDEYCDEDLSGAGTYRPEFERLINDCKKKKLDIVLCKSQSRFSRDMEIVEKYINNKFKEWNIRFIGLADNADTDIKANKKSRQINGLVNEWFLEDTSNNIRSAFQAKMLHGEFISPFAPFGYEISSSDKNKLVIDIKASKVVKLIYNLYLNGYGLMEIAKYLNNKDIPSPSLYKYQKGIKLNIISKQDRDKIKWNSNAIKNILNNEVYIGNLVQGKRTTISYKNHKIKRKSSSEWIRKENTHEPIIDKEVFYKVQKYLKERKKVIKVNNMVHNFSGKVFCLECGSIMRKKNTKLHQYLVCSNKSNKNCINNKAIRYDILENIILKEINKKITTYYDYQYLCSINKMKGNSLDKIKHLQNEIIEVNNNLLELKKYLKSLYNDKVNSLITIEQFKTLINTYEKDKFIYENKLKLLNEELDNYKNKDNNKLLSKYKKIKKLNRVMIEEFIKSIHIGKIDNNLIRNIYIKWDY